MNPFRKHLSARKLVQLAACGMVLQTAGAAIVSFTEATNPAGVFSSSANVETGTIVSTRAATLVSGANTFTHWTLNGVRRSDASGRSLNPVSFTILEPTAAVANYLPTALDSDNDGLPDYYETEFFNSLVQTPASDTDADGFSVSSERIRNMSPVVANALIEGGISRRRGAKVLMVAPSQFTLTESSDPVGIVNSTRTVFENANVSLSVAPDTSGALRFTGWYNGNSRIDSPLRRQPASLTVSANTTVVARYLDQSTDTDSDGIPDWYEQFQFGDLTKNGSADSDDDGFTLNDEIARGQAPRVADAISEGGVSRRRGAVMTVSPVNYVTCTLASNPPGLVNQTLTAAEGSEIATQNLSGVEIGGSRFVGWEIGAIRQLDPSGAAAGIARFAAVDGLVATARFIALTQDADADRIPDWYEWVYFGNLGTSPSADPDGDGLTLDREHLGGFSPLQTDLVSEGGISRRRSTGKTAVNLQPFERLKQIRVDAELTPWFSEDPAVSPPQGIDFGSHPSPVFCDWDGDGDPDLFVAAEGGASVYENIGSKFSMRLTDRTANFGGFASLCAGITRPHLTAGDWNLDGDQDLAISDGAGNLHLIASSHVFSGSGHGTLTSTFIPSEGGGFPAVGDLDGDGKPDLLIVSPDGVVTFYQHSGMAGTPYGTASSEGMTGSLVEGVSSLTIGDIDLDGRNDVLAADNEGRIWEFHNQTNGSFLLTSKVWGGSGVGFAPSPCIAAGDLEGDGDIDLIGGTPEGGLFALRDPKVGRPTALTASSGADTVFLEWNPDWQSRIKGYHVYRSTDGIAPKSRVNADPVATPRYVDRDLQLTPAHFYQVTALTQAIYAGNSVPTLLESPPSATVSAAVRRVSLALQDTAGNPGGIVKVYLSIANSIGLSGQGMELRIQYPAGLVPSSQAFPGFPTVEASGLSADLTFSTNEETAGGELIISGTAGNLANGQGKLFTINFLTSETAVVGSSLALNISSAVLYDSQGMITPATLSGSTVTIEATPDPEPPPEGGILVGSFGKGDINGDGWVNEEDEELLKSLLPSSADDPTPKQRSAGDTNGDGKINHRDLIGLKRIIDGLEP